MSEMVRRAVKVPLLAGGVVRRLLRSSAQHARYSFLIYHRVDGTLPLELDMPPDLFRRQVAFLHATQRVIPYEVALKALEEGGPDPDSGYVLTFDDGYVDFYTIVFPLLQEYSLPAILFVTTGFVEEGKPYPLLSRPGAAVQPVTWDMLGEMAETGLVTLGAHTHTHPVLTAMTSRQIEEELAKPLELFERRLGLRPAHFAYPRAVANADVRARVVRYYDSAVGGGGRMATATGFDRYRIPRIPIRRSDGWHFFRAKLLGLLEAEEPTYARLHALGGRRAT